MTRIVERESPIYAQQNGLLLTDAPQKENPHGEKPSRGSGQGYYPRRGTMAGWDRTTMSNFRWRFYQ